MSFITGHYTAAYFGNSIGTTREGFRIRENHHHQPVLTDEGGEAPVDGVQQGTETTITLDWVDYNLIKSALYVSNPQGQPMANVGKTLTGIAHQLVLTAAAGTPAAAQDGVGNSWVFYKAIITDETELLLATKLRQGPATFRVFPDPENSNKTYAIITAPTGSGS